MSTQETVLSKQTIAISMDDLPVSCPMPGVQLWCSHPKVYLPIEETGQATCPYCSTHYIVKS